MFKKIYDFAIIGGGVYGLNTAKRVLSNLKGSSVIILEKNNKIYGEIPEYEINYPLYFKKGTLKYELLEKGNLQLEDFCYENKITYLNKHQIVLHKSKMDLVSLKSSDNLIQINYDELNESMIYKNKKEEYFINKKCALVDKNNIKKVLYEQIIDDNNLEILKKTNIEYINKHENYHKITTNKKQEICAKYIINVSEDDSYKYARFLGLNNYRQFNYTYTYYKLPNKLPLNTIISSPPYKIHPGLNLFKDYDDYPVLGPVIKLSIQSKTVFQKLNSLFNYYRFLPLLVKNSDYEMDICYNHPYKAKMFYQSFFNLFYVIGTETIHSQKIKNVLIDGKEIIDDIIITKENNSIHILNNNIDSTDLALFLPITDQIIKLIN